MKLIRNKMRIGLRLLFGAATGIALLLLCIFAASFYLNSSKAESLDNDARVWPESELKYYLTVTYDGVDKYGVQSGEGVRAEIQGGVVEVSDKIPDGLEFVGFETTATGKIGAVMRGDSATSCVGRVIDDTQEARVDAGTWNNAHTQFYYHGLHYDADTRIVSFKANSIQAGCDLSIGIITRTPELSDAERMDFFNTATVKEGLINKNSNTVHVWMGKETAILHTVSYSYTSAPANAPALPADEHYVQGANVGVAMAPTLDGYSFSGWSTTDASVSDGSFVMPDGDVAFVGSFTENPAEPEYTVSYEITGEMPEDYVAPRTKSYKENDIVTLDSAKAGDIIDDYVFGGWTTEDVTILDGSFDMPDHNVTIRGSFTRREFTVQYYFIGEVLPPNASSLLPATQTYHAGDEVTVADSPAADGYKFSGWYSDNTFTMPANNVTIEGEWTVVVGTFAPTISVEVIDPEDHYIIGQTVQFKITVTNTADFAITDVNVLENLAGAKFVAGSGYTISADSIAVIPTISAGSSVVLYANYYVSENATATITNEVELSGARATVDHYEIDPDQNYTATANFNVEYWESEPVLSGISINSILLYVIITILGACGIIVGVIFKQRKEKDEEE